MFRLCCAVCFGFGFVGFCDCCLLSFGFLLCRFDLGWLFRGHSFVLRVVS